MATDSRGDVGTTSSNMDNRFSGISYTVYDALGRVLDHEPARHFGYSYFDPTHPTNRLGSVSIPTV